MRIQFMQKKCYGLTGYPLGHSLSPFIHKEIMALRGIDADYQLYPIKPEELERGFETQLKKLNGFNVTIPNKLNIIPFLDSLSPRAQLYGAVNTVVCEDKKFIGHNTDCSGFLRSLQRADIALDGRVCVCGAGGVARMFAIEAAIAGASVTLAVRPSGIEKAAALQKEISEKTGKLAGITTLSEVGKGYDLIINGTPLGMSPNTDSCPVSVEAVCSAGAVFDAVYNPLDTVLVTLAKEAGIKHCNGLPMLVFQAVAAQELWNGISLTKEECDRLISMTEKELDAK